jgi:hypothetical protein
MSFLESVSALGNEILIPINRIQYITISYVTDYVIRIISDDEGNLEEHFGIDQDRAYARYESIKKIIKAK